VWSPNWVSDEKGKKGTHCVRDWVKFKGNEETRSGAQITSAGLVAVEGRVQRMGRQDAEEKKKMPSEILESLGREIRFGGGKWAGRHEN